MVTEFPLVSKLWLSETFIITPSVKLISGMQVILLLEWNPHKFTACYANYETCEDATMNTEFCINLLHQFTSSNEAKIHTHSCQQTAQNYIYILRKSHLKLHNGFIFKKFHLHYFCLTIPALTLTKASRPPVTILLTANSCQPGRPRHTEFEAQLIMVDRSQSCRTDIRLMIKLITQLFWLQRFFGFLKSKRFDRSCDTNTQLNCNTRLTKNYCNALSRSRSRQETRQNIIPETLTSNSLPPSSRARGGPAKMHSLALSEILF